VDTGRSHIKKSKFFCVFLFTKSSAFFILTYIFLMNPPRRQTIMKRFFILLPLGLLAGCVTGPGYQARMSAYIGGSPQTLVQQLGVPDKQITVGGTQYLAYVQHDEDSAYPFGVSGGWGGPFFPHAYYYAAPVQTLGPVSCETTFTVQADKVTGVKFRGDECE
jgi:hypothetical protein